VGTDIKPFVMVVHTDKTCIIAMSDDVFSRKPFRTGNSQVITVSGIPGIPDDKELHFKQVEVNGVTATLMASYDEISKHELEQIDELSVD